jgi:hypothetical protein
MLPFNGLMSNTFPLRVYVTSVFKYYTEQEVSNSEEGIYRTALGHRQYIKGRHLSGFPNFLTGFFMGI